MKTLHQNSVRGLALILIGAALGAPVCLSGKEFREEIHKTLPLNSDGRISLDNVNGSIRIEVWDRPEVQHDAVKKAKKQEHLEAVKIEIDSKATRLRIHTRYPSSKGWLNNNTASVDYTLKVPKAADIDEVSSVNGGVDITGVEGKIKASTVNGSLNARGLTSDAHFSTVNGAIKAAFDNIDTVNSISFSAVNGAVDLQLPPHPNADVSLDTVNGNIHGDLTVKKNWPIGREVKAQLGEGGTKIKGSTVNGGMKVTIARS